MGIQSRGRIDLPYGNMSPFPQIPNWSLVDSHTQARADLDTTGLYGTGPLRAYYWVQNVTQAHEDYHVSDFYSATYFPYFMDSFKNTGVESPNIYVLYDCNNWSTTRSSGALGIENASFSQGVQDAFNNTWNAYFPLMEVRGHSYSNPLYVPIRNAIPNP
jgi:hypothetical protein